MITDVECICHRCGFTNRRRVGRIEPVELKDTDLTSSVGGAFIPNNISIDVLVEENKAIYNNYCMLKSRMTRLLMWMEADARFKEGIEALRSVSHPED